MNVLQYDRFSPAIRSFVLCAMAATFLLALTILLELNGYEYHVLFRDRIISDAPMAGLLSDFGIALMAIVAIASAVTWKTTRNPGHLLLAIFAANFSLDDALMFHERLGDMEIFLLGLHGLLFALSYLAFRQLIIWPLLFVGLCFATSIVADLLPQLHSLSWMPYFLLEDGSKLCGIVLLTAFAFSEWATEKRARAEAQA